MISIGQRQERSQAAERMDGSDFTVEEYERTLAQLERINVLTGGHRGTRCAVEELIDGEHARTGKTEFSILDFGFGGGDTLRALEKSFRHKPWRVNWHGVDLNPMAAQFARARSHDLPIQYHAADVFGCSWEKEFGREKFDVVISSMTLHHFADDQAVRVLKLMHDRSQVGWVVNDLHRHRIAEGFIWLAPRILRATPMIQHDAPISVARSFLSNELLELCRRADISLATVSVNWRWAFRWILIGKKKIGKES